MNNQQIKEDQERIANLFEKVASEIGKKSRIKSILNRQKNDKIKSATDLVYDPHTDSFIEAQAVRKTFEDQMREDFAKEFIPL